MFLVYMCHNLICMTQTKMIKNVIGKRFNNLVILEILEDQPSRYRMVRCKCDCGNIADKRLTLVINGYTKTCGCYSPRASGMASYEKLFREYKRNAVNRDLTFELNLTDFIEIISQKCHYCGADPKPWNRYITKSGKVKTTEKFKRFADLAWININGIDRKDSSIGYIHSNCLPCCSNCNYAKREMDYTQFIDYLNKLVEFRSRF